MKMNPRANKKSIKSLLVLSAFGWMGVNLPLNAATVFTDTFDSGTGTWATSGGFNSISVADDSSGIGSGNALNGDVTGGVNALTTGFSSTTLSSIGDSITLSFDFRWDPIPGTATSRAPNFGLYNTQATSTLDDDKGYFLSTAADVRLQYESGTNNTIVAGNDNTNIDSTSWSGSEYAGAKANLSITITRIVDTNTDFSDDVSLSFDFIDYGTPANNTTSSAIDITNQTFTFNEIAIRSSKNFFLDNVAVTTIPEPSTLMLLGLAMGGLLLSSRYRRKQ